MKKNNKLHHLLVFVSVPCCIALLQNLEARVITKIVVKGNKRIDEETIKSRLPIKENDDIDDDDANEAIKALYESELFEDVKVKFSEKNLIVDVKEAPIIEKISFEGNKKLKDEDLLKACPIKVKETLSQVKIRAFQAGLLQEYQRKAGLLNARVNTKIIKLPDNKVNLIFEIEENRPTKISKIVFYGNKHISSSELQNVMSTQVSHWYRLFAQDDTYSDERLEEDKRAIIQYYKDHGFAEAEIVSTNVELEPSGHKFIISFHIKEGQRFKFGKITLNSSVKRVNEKVLNKKPKCKTGKNFNASFVSMDSARILVDISKQGFSTVTVDPQFDSDRKNRKINIRYDIKEGEHKYISKIIIRGNNRTRDHVIYKKLLFEEGDVYNKTLIALSEGRLRASGFFNIVNIETIPDPVTPDKVMVVVNVDEAKTGQVSFKAGYSSMDGPFINLGYGEHNFLGTGKAINVSISANKEESGRSYKFENGQMKKIDRESKFAPLGSVSASISDPHMFGRDIEGSLSFYKYTSSPFDTFSVRNLGAAVGLSYAIDNNWTQNWEVATTRMAVDNVAAHASPAIKSQTLQVIDGRFRPDKELKYYQNKLVHTIGYSNRIYEGFLKGSYSASLSTTLFYNTNSKQFDLKNVFKAGYLKDLGRSMALKVQASVGMLNALGSKDLNIADGFTNSLSSVRGFEAHTLSGWYMTARRQKNPNKNAKDNEKYINIALLDATSSKKFFNGSVEFSFPLDFGLDLPITGFIFCDMGYYWDPVKINNSAIFKKTTYSMSDYDKLLTLQEAKDIVNKAANKKAEVLTFESEKIKATGQENETIMAKSGNKEFKVDKLICPLELGEYAARNAPHVGHKAFTENKFFVSVGFGVVVITPLGPFTVSWGFPIINGQLSMKNVFIISGGTQF